MQLKKKIIACFSIILLLLNLSFVYASERELFGRQNRPKILHLTFHKGCMKEIDSVAAALGYDVVTWFIPSLPPLFFDGVTSGNALYNIGHDRAERIWELHKDYFETFDIILTSDTAPLSRIFLQNGFKKPLIIWVCNRFDYYDGQSLDCEFPDREFYDLFRQATQQENVKVIAYTAFEQYYAKRKGVDLGSLIITPCALNQDSHLLNTAIPSHVNKADSFALPPYHNETNFMKLSNFLTKSGIKNYCGRYNGSLDLYDFKGIIHLPYSWSNLALFENMAIGIPYFIPSKAFFKELAASGNYFFPNLPLPVPDDLISLSEWYSSEHQEIFTFFDSWSDLKVKLETTDYQKKREKIRHHAVKHKKTMLKRWKEALSFDDEQYTTPYVIGDLMGQFGNQLFIIAAATSLALDNDAIPIFPGFLNPVDPDPVFKLGYNYEQVFSHLDVVDPLKEDEFIYKEREFNYNPIPYQDDMRIRGWFQSEKYFLNNKDEIIELFAPSSKILDHLSSKFGDLLQASNTVGIHVRRYSAKENPNQSVYFECDMDYFEKAMAMFPQDAIFLIFSNDMRWCKANFSRLKKNIRFIENGTLHNDFYLMSLCKHNIISNSSFSWWAAYLNTNPAKKVIVPPLWFQPNYIANPKDLIPPEWIILDGM